MIRVLGFCASPRDGNSKYLLEIALEAAVTHGQELGIEVETEYCSIRGKSIHGCVMCQQCMKDGICAIKDDFEELRSKWYDADVILYSVPVYHLGMPAQLKAFLDRLGNSNYGRANRLYGENRRGPLKPMQVVGCIAQGIHIFSGQEQTMIQIANHAILLGALPISGDGWESYIGVGGWTRNLESKNALRDLYQNDDYDTAVTVKASRSLAQRAVETASLLQVGACGSPRIMDLPAYRSFRQRVEDHTTKL